MDKKVKIGGNTMLIYQIPGKNDIEIENIVFDYNGTIAVDGKVIEGVSDLLVDFRDEVEIYILTADTYGTVKQECIDLDAKLLTFSSKNTSELKKNIVKELNGEKTICVGNGFNDISMFKEAAISIAVIEAEGVCGQLLKHADIITRSILEAIEIILNENKIKAVLRS